MPVYMKKFFTLFFLAGIFLISSAQTGSEDYWLSHGFSSGQTVYTNQGSFYDDGGDSLYHAGQNWSVRFCSENGNPITVDFDHFRTIYDGGDYHNYDYMNINYTGIGAGYVAYSNNTPQFSFTSPDGCITFGFHSNSLSVLDSGWVAAISANPPPVNNDQCSAVELSVGNVCSPSYFSNKGAWDTRELGSPPCHEFFGGDVWFKAAIPASGQLKVATFEGSLKNAVMILYSGTCTSLNLLACVYNSAMPVKTISGTPGDVVFIRIYGDQAKSGTFGICATDPLAPITGFSGPGGVGDSLSNEIWLRADRGPVKDGGLPAIDGDRVRIWKDQSGNHHDPTQPSVSGQAVLAGSSVGTMPSLRFDGANTNYIHEMGALSAPLTIFAVSRFNDVTADQSVFTLGDAGIDYTASLSRDTDKRYYSLTGVKKYGPVINADSNLIFEVNHRITPAFHQLALNGSVQPVEDFDNPLATDGSLHIGSSGTMSGYFNGDLAELIMYNKNVNKAQEIIINNYLAAKYGINIGAVDRYSYETKFKYDVSGIGRVDAQNIHSKAQSDSILTIGGAGDLEDGEFLLFGHDGGDISTWTDTGTPGSDPNVKRIMREWRVDQSGGDGVGTVTLGLSTGKLPPLPAGFLDYNLLVDQDGDFSTGAAAYGLIKSGNEYLANDIDVPDGSYITIIAIKPFVQFDTSSFSGPETLQHPEFFVSLNYAISDPLEVNYFVTGGTATGDGIDYSLNPGIISFNPGQKSGKIIPLIVNDTIVEIPDEYFSVVLRDPSAGVDLGTDSTFTYTINDDDLDLAISATDTLTGSCRTSTSWLYVSARGQGPFTYAWSPADSISDPANDTTEVYPSVSTLYTVTVTDRNGYSKQKSVMIHVAAPPAKIDVTPSGTLSLCEGDSLTLTADIAYSYVWSSGENSRSVWVKKAGEYSVVSVDSLGCFSPGSNPVTVQVLSVPVPVISALTNTMVCEGDTVRMESTPANDYFWSTGDHTQQISLVSSAQVTLHVEGANGCISSESGIVEITVNPLPPAPVISPSGEVRIFSSDSVLLSSSVADGYLWSTGAETKDIYVSEEGGYTVRAVSGQGCVSPASDSVIVIVTQRLPKASVTVNGPTSLCEGQWVELTAQQAYSYLWSNGDTTQTIRVAETGSYSLIITNEEGVQSLESDPVIIEVFPNPEPSLQKTDVSCFGGSDATATVSAAGGLAPYTFFWSNGATSSSISGLAQGGYSVTVTDARGCSSSDTLSIDQPGSIVITAAVLPAYCSEASDGSISVQVTGGVSPYSYLWNEGNYSDESLTNLPPGTYSVEVTDTHNCSTTKDFILDSANPLCFRIPEIITPNGDGLNDTWQIDGLDLYPDVVVQVYDRWGKQVFYSRGYDQPWDGTFHGEELPMESYHYIIDLQNGKKPVIGNITIVR